MFNLKALALTALTATTLGLGAVAPANANSLIEADNARATGNWETVQNFVNNPIAAEFNNPRLGGTTDLITKCEARRHFQGKGYFFKTKKMSAQIIAEHKLPKGMNRNEICEAVLLRAGK